MIKSNIPYYGVVLQLLYYSWPPSYFLALQKELLHVYQTNLWNQVVHVEIVQNIKKAKKTLKNVDLTLAQINKFLRKTDLVIIAHKRRDQMILGKPVNLSHAPNFKEFQKMGNVKIVNLIQELTREVLLVNLIVVNRHNKFWSMEPARLVQHTHVVAGLTVVMEKTVGQIPPAH